jgi:hypothetical protein
MYGSAKQHEPTSAVKASREVKRAANLGFRFTNLPGDFEIVALGHFAENTLVESDPTVLVLLRVPGGAARARHVSTTLLGRLKLGTRVTGGQLSNDPILGTIESLQVAGGPQESVRFECALGDSEETRAKFQTWWIKKIGSETLWRNVHDVWIEVIPAVGADQKIVHLLIPHTVIFQAYFASSSRMIRAVLRNRLELYESAGRLLEEGDLRVGEVTVRPGWSDLDALFAARLIGSNKAARATNLVNASLVEALAHHHATRKPGSKQALPMQTCLPFEGESDMTVRFVDVPNGTGIRTLLVHEILKCNGSTGVDRHRVIRETYPSRKTPTIKEADPDAEPLVQQFAVPHPDGTIDEHSEPSSELPAITHREYADLFESILAKFERKKVAAPIKSVSGANDGNSTNLTDHEATAHDRHSAGQTTRQNIDVQSAGTGEAIAGGTAHPLQFADVSATRPDPPAFELAIRAAESLVISHGIRFEPFCVLNGERILESWSSFVPSMVDLLHVDWASGELNRVSIARRVLVLELQFANCYGYIFEIERLDGDAGRYQMALLMNPNRVALQPGEVQDLLKCLAVSRGVWSAMPIKLKSVDLEHLLFVHLNHVSNQEPEALAARWIKKWRKLDPNLTLQTLGITTEEP